MTGQTLNMSDTSWELPGREKTVHYFQELTSTMDKAREMAAKGCEHMTVVVAEQQSKGRGRLQRSWISEKGSLFFTMVLRPEIPPALAYRANFAASLTLSETLRDRYGIQAFVKWPNDILVDEKKVVGILSEMGAGTDRVANINIGIGINVNAQVSPVEQKAISIKELTGKNESRKELLADFLGRFEKRIKTIGSENYISEWKKHTLTIGREVRIETPLETSVGRALDVDEEGALILELGDGSTKKIIYGDCFHN